MTVAEMIKKTRTDSNMTQEEYANKFFISRQTVSSWENGKSTPELQTLIDICNTYNMSLDALLNDDRAYVKKISIIQKIVRKLKFIIPVIVVILCVYFIYFGAWSAKNKTMVSDYVDKVQSLGYVKEGKVYKLHDDKVTYHAGNQELPKYKWDFSNKSLSADYKDDDMIWDIHFTSEDNIGYFNIQVNVDSYIDGEITSKGAIEYKEVSKLAKQVLSDNRAEIEKIVKKLNRNWQAIYG